MNWNDLTWSDVVCKAKALKMEVVVGEWIITDDMRPTCGCLLTILAIHKRLQDQGDTEINKSLVGCWIMGDENHDSEPAIMEILGIKSEIEVGDFVFAFDRTAPDPGAAAADIAITSHAGAAGKRLAMSMNGLLPADAKGGF